MSIRIAIAGIDHETNTFQNDVQLSDLHIQRGQSIIEKNQGTRYALGGMIDAGLELGVQLVPTFYAFTEVGGKISADVYEKLVEELLQRLEEAQPLDAVALALHGAGAARGVDNIEVDICKRIRKLLGPDVKIVAAFDLHGNVSPELAELLDCGFGCHYAPHTDMYERGQDAMRIIPRMLEGAVSPRTHIEKLPLLFLPTTNIEGPGAAINEMCRSIEQEPGMISCTFFFGFPYADVPDGGASVWAISDGDAGKAREAAERIARFVWDRRADFPPKTYGPEEAIKLAVDSGDWPVALLDVADDPGGGCPADGTHLLQAMLDADLASACFALICDPEVALQAHKAGTGATIDVELGGKSHPLHGNPITARAHVKALTDGRFVHQSSMGRGLDVNLGRTARLQIGGVDIIVVSERHQPWDPEIFLIHGIDPSRFRIVGLKSSNHWRDAYSDIIKRDLTVDTPGLLTRDLTRFSYERTPRPIWPLDHAAAY